MSTDNPEIMERIARTIQKIKRYSEPAATSMNYGSYRGFRSGGSKWPYGLSGDGSSLYLDHRRLRQNARRAVHDNLNARAIVERYADTVADVGIKMEAAPLTDLLGISSEQGEAWGEDVSQRFHLWSQSKKAHRAEEMSFYQAHRLYAFCQQRDNDNFVRLYYSSDRSLINPLQFEFIDADQIVGDALTTSVGYHSRRDGIERDAAGKAIAYNVRIRQQNGKTENVRVPAVGRGSGRIMMLHGYSAEYAGQSRGYSRLSHVLQEFQNLTDFKSAQIMKAINQSQLWMFIKPSADAAASNPFGIDGMVGPPSDFYGSNPTPPADAQNVTPVITNPVTHYGMENVNMATPGSTAVMNLDRGEEIKPFVNTAPADGFDKFVDSFSAYLAASAGVPIEVLLMRFNQNYSASRGALILFWRIANIWRNEEITDFCNPVYFSWLSEEIALGRVNAPGWSDPVLRSAWLNSNWHGISLPNIDPVRSAKAAKLNIEMGATTMDKNTMELNGSSGKSNRAKLKRELSELPTVPFDLKEKNNG